MPVSQIDTRLNISSVPEKTTSSDARSSPQSDGTEQIGQVEALRKEFNAAVLNANYEVSLSVKNEPMSLLYQTAIDAINKELEGDFGENSIQSGYEQGLDVSPEATAGRIVNFSTSLFPLYQQQHPELNESEQVEKFVDIISGGIDTGFSEAREILDGLGVLEGEIAENIDKTYDLVQEGLQAFKKQFEVQE
ncbi:MULTISPECIES: DUF5610 domain-containing protein [unclassified Oleiphilus]|uniref:DUF5610 domain-containing protein n=2 Tax=Oleiphilus TaxID=141450 RepID=UPI0007C2B766|nr:MULTISPECIES: DUF5610 domain-containing protein [unclassified Oleiphilus]KZY50474.1 hypothetical protein A3732_21500 [Oleiphilus sp. HI0050]KZY88406.1 hypothetical protein A3743_11730 [Oleiphilus sp. HI0072]KZZ10681.1 hypothetical protein A3749_10620 [Oleiphilus sp. HI0078]KZY29116.1 hypothetical protein A3729_01630 [Oleiphilus sp. HI0043]KZY51539.1 hypothetical protein A3732_00465 [Oleiphilus sp. HI0050]